MERRQVLAALAALAAGRALPAGPPPPATALPRVAILFFGSRANLRSRAEAFTRGMAELGHVDGKTVAFDWKNANGQEDLLKSYAAEMRSGYAVIVSASNHTSRALRDAGATQVPIVMAATEEPASEGFVRSVEHPGGNFTGVSASVLDRIDKQVELLFAVAPRLTRITVLLNPDNPAYRTYRGRLQAVVRAGTRLIFANASNIEQIDAAFPARVRDDADGLIVMNDTLLFNERRTVVESASRAKRPAVYPMRGFVEAGGLMSYGANLEANFLRAASYVDRILKGAKAADLPVEAPAKIELVVNRDTMHTQGLELPPDLARQAIYFPR